MAERQFVVYKLNNEEYGIEITSVEEILKYEEITSVPQADEFVLGVINLRGKVIPIYNLKKKYYGEDIEPTEETRIVVISLDGISLGMIVDSVSEVIRIPVVDIDQTASIFSDQTDNSISGVAKTEDRLLMIMDIDKLFTDKITSQMQEIV